MVGSVAEGGGGWGIVDGGYWLLGVSCLAFGLLGVRRWVERATRRHKTLFATFMVRASVVNLSAWGNFKRTHFYGDIACFNSLSGGHCSCCGDLCNEFNNANLDAMIMGFPCTPFSDLTPVRLQGLTPYALCLTPYATSARPFGPWTLGPGLQSAFRFPRGSPGSPVLSHKPQTVAARGKGQKGKGVSRNPGSGSRRLCALDSDCCGAGLPFKSSNL